MRKLIKEIAKNSGWAVMLNSGYEEHEPLLHIAGFGWSLWLRMPKWLITPHRRKVRAQTWDAATVLRMGRDWYWDETRREFGFSLHDNCFAIHYGVMPDCSPGDKRWSYYLPWAEWRFHRMSYYGLDGKHFATIPKDDGKVPGWQDGRWEREKAIKASVPTVTFAFDDFDGERIECKTMIEEREWLRGAKWTKWLSLFYPPKVRRSLELEFSKETGPRKGSWKGGTMGHSIDMLPGELHEAAFRRYCAQNRMAFIGTAP